MAFRAFLRWLRFPKRPPNPESAPVDTQASKPGNIELDKQDQLIAKHTVIQTRTNILSVVFSAITAVALVILTYFQWQVSERGVAAGLRAVELEYAKARLTYSATQTVALNDVFQDLESRLDDLALTPMLETASLRINGEASSIRIRPTQYFRVTEIFDDGEKVTHNGGGCLFRALFYYEFYGERDFYAPDFYRNSSYNPFFENRLSKKLIIEPTEVEFLISYIDVFDQQRFDTLLVSNGGAILVERNARSRPHLPLADISIENGRLRVVKVGSEPSKNQQCDSLLFNTDERPLRRRSRQ